MVEQWNVGMMEYWIDGFRDCWSNKVQIHLFGIQWKFGKFGQEEQVNDGMAEKGKWIDSTNIWDVDL